MPPAVNRSALVLYSHRLVEDGYRFRLHASPDKSPYLYVREIVDGKGCGSSRSPLWNGWPEQDKADTSSSISGGLARWAHTARTSARLASFGANPAPRRYGNGLVRRSN